MNDSQLATNVLPANEKAAHTWSNGGAAYDRISRQIADAIEHCVDRIRLPPGARVLDVATGTGWTARRLAARGHSVVGVDFAADVLAAARSLSPDTAIDYRVADAEALPFEDDSFDAVVSTFGVMFCARPERAAAELARVCKPGGQLALATWATEGGIRDMFSVIVRYLPGQRGPDPSPFAWGDPERLRALFGTAFDVGIETATSWFRADDGEDAFQQFATGYGPVVSLLQSLEPERVQQFHRDFVAFHEQYRTELGILVPRPYVITAGKCGV